MEKEFVTYQQALKLKELGFDEPCFTYHHGGFLEFCLDGHNNVYERKNSSFMRSVSAPTLSQAFRWFREKYNLHHSINIYNDLWMCLIKSTVSSETEISGYLVDAINNGHPTFNSYEEAESACLDKLIELGEKIERAEHGVYQ